MEKMIAICGLDCSKCDAYIATHTHNPAALENLKSLRHNK
ncbi:MAG: DUF3795 domain-containing protein [Bacteroidaceae bacterium]|nr:DUF3795 domain-containing protein [Bacteroidaceae bacterium]